MAGNVKNIGLTSFDDLFKSEEERQQDSHERILNIPINEIHPYARQPYSIERPTPDLVRLMDSIEQVGVAEPLILRPALRAAILRAAMRLLLVIAGTTALR